MPARTTFLSRLSSCVPASAGPSPGRAERVHSRRRLASERRATAGGRSASRTKPRSARQEEKRLRGSPWSASQSRVAARAMQACRRRWAAVEHSLLYEVQRRVWCLVLGLQSAYRLLQFCTLVSGRKKVSQSAQQQKKVPTCSAAAVPSASSDTSRAASARRRPSIAKDRGHRSDHL